MRLPRSRLGLLLAALYAAGAVLSMGLWYYARAVANAGIYGERWGMRAGLLAAPWYFVPMLLLPGGHRLAYAAGWVIGVAINATLIYYLVRVFERWRVRRRARAV